MKKQLRFTVIFIIIFIVSCSNVESDIENVIPNPENQKSEPELIEEITDVEEPEEYIEFFLDDEQVTINLKGMPILNNYLKGTASRKQSLEEMELSRIYSENENIYLLEFSCNNSLCSYILLNQSRDNPSFLIADLAKLLEIKPSPDDSKLLFLFERDSGPSQGLKDIAVIDIKDWQQLPLRNETTDDQILGYKWPLAEVKWLDNNSINVTKPDSIEPEDPSDRHATEDTPVTDIILNIVNEDEYTDIPQ
ncbi:hypothetical protein [Virgibacillus sp. YIM 98842]|uniref:hypothetical protein n=1 Tax=Virgibacillus sp. YIM 98842 TaxID=2663533 RepID=UPI0013D93914|nr:hypothetical protein [Virgibacillus sp. YIM 98842]